jgi:hypothetical protein
MRRARGQSTVELIVLSGLAVAVAAGLAGLLPVIASSVDAALRRTVRHEHAAQDDRWALGGPTWGPVIRRYAPDLVLERDRYRRDRSVPVDFEACRALACAAYGTSAAAAYVHLVRRPGRAYIEYWLYYPDSQSDHLPVAALAGYHRDDWEGVIVRIDAGGVAARASAHLGFNGAGPWWSPDPGWHPIGPHPLIYRAAGSHANGFRSHDIDLAGDDWNGTLGRASLALLLPGDAAPSARRRFAAGALAPWRKRVWVDPEARGTSADGSRGILTRAAAAWALVVEGGRELAR